MLFAMSAPGGFAMFAPKETAGANLFPSFEVHHFIVEALDDFLQFAVNLWP
jgi:hypothetical protein